MKRSAYLRGCILLTTILWLVSGAHALEPDQIALVVNRNVPESADLAKFYAKARGVPGDRIIQLDLPAAVDEIPFDDYDALVARPVRQFLQQHGLQQQVRCLVTFYGVPLRIAKRTITPEETAELERLRAELQQVQRRLSEAVGVLEQLAQGVEPSFKPQAAGAADALARRADEATRVLRAGLERLNEAPQRRRIEAQLERIVRFLSTPLGQGSGPATGPAGVDPQQLAQLLRQPQNAAAREGVRAMAHRAANPFAYERVLQEQIAALNPEHTDSALDSELALLWVPSYPRAGWQPNPLAYPFAGTPNPPPVVLVMRLDAPTPQRVREIIETSIQVERTGLNGKFVVDSRGIAVRPPDGAPDAFGIFDERLRALAALVKSIGRPVLVFDEGPDVLPPDSVSDVALYCGWYSVGKYVPSMKFSPGAVGYHVASYELTSLRDETNTGWGRGMIIDGAVAVLGPVAEPLLHAFPAPDDFFPLLMTGRLPLAEVYWRTSPLTSWKMCVIGDPLYTPFRVNPLLRPDQLPERLRPLFSDTAAAPTRR